MGFKSCEHGNYSPPKFRSFKTGQAKNAFFATIIFLLGLFVGGMVGSNISSTHLLPTSSSSVEVAINSSILPIMREWGCGHDNLEVPRLLVPRLGGRTLERVPIGHDRIVIDIGLGYDAAETLQALSQNFVVFAFDPDPVSVSRLEQTLSRNASFANRYTKVKMVPGLAPDLSSLQPAKGGHVFIFHAAVGSKTGRASMNGNGNVGSVVSGRGDTPVVTLDDVMPEWASNIHFLKIDTQGYELNVLEGCTRLLKTNQIRYILFEFSPELMMRSKTGNPLALLGMLPAMGYICFDMMGEHLALPRPSFPLNKYYADLLGWHRYGPGVEHPKKVEGFGPWDDIMCANINRVLQ